MAEIWNDDDVRGIYVLEGGGPQLSLNGLAESDRMLIERFLAADQAIDDLARQRTVIDALVVGVAAFEGLSSVADHRVGWMKFVVFMTACNVQILWERFRASDETAIFADWVTSTLERNGWGWDGNVSALGVASTSCQAIAAQAGGGVQKNPETGKFEGPIGDAARSYDPDTGVVRPMAPAPSSPPTRGLFRRRR